MAKYKAKESFKGISLKGTGITLGEVQCLEKGGTIVLESLPKNLEEHLENVETPKVKKVFKKSMEGDK
tara:strand:- start:275 stop:478 length:204 start_codon:yes stop_codon:yes gene_type:complete